ncbi:uncharacterized protein EDB91DRAFT_1249036 [Suillus paluster]|uniref:uncharacterized protein n=1 Tax=Suillus paluster TaxID=48578 RepID=UPI001B870131|nr:uncharacterized protein EDB91DRAFT_1249036 [Suillus paluster]KAG1738868.1 hypothetical protein EDB91DRAFT_1249036 [Suillus paluster]
MSKPMVHETQNEKARARMARLRAVKKESRSSASQPMSLSAQTILCLPDLKAKSMAEMRLLIGQWQYCWGPNNLWEKTFNEKLRSAQDRGSGSVNDFFSQCEAHTTDGQQLLNEFKRIAYSPLVLSEVRFFEVKLDEYAPAVPLSRTSSTRYYEQA